VSRELHRGRACNVRRTVRVRHAYQVAKTCGKKPLGDERFGRSGRDLLNGVTQRNKQLVWRGKGRPAGGFNSRQHFCVGLSRVTAKLGVLSKVSEDMKVD